MLILFIFTVKVQRPIGDMLMRTQSYFPSWLDLRKEIGIAAESTMSGYGGYLFFIWCMGFQSYYLSFSLLLLVIVTVKIRKKNLHFQFLAKKNENDFFFSLAWLFVVLKLVRSTSQSFLKLPVKYLTVRNEPHDFKLYRSFIKNL